MYCVPGAMARPDVNCVQAVPQLPSSHACKQPLHQPPRQHAGDAPAIVAGRERRLHRHDLVAHEVVEALEHALVERAAAQLARAFEQHGPRIGAGDGNAQVGERVAVAAQRHGHAGDRILDRAADADLVVGRAQAGRRPSRARRRRIRRASAPGSACRRPRPSRRGARGRCRGPSAAACACPSACAMSTSASSVIRAGARSPLKVAKHTPRLLGATWHMSPVVLRQ